MQWTDLLGVHPRLGQVTYPLSLAFCICKKRKCSPQARSVRTGVDDCKEP